MSGGTLRVLAFCLFSLTCQGQTLLYSLLRTQDPQPAPRFDGTITYDPAGRQIFLFGGQDTAPRNDLWAYSPAQGRWNEIQASGPRPPARFGHTLILDSARRRLVVFGGQASGFFSDVWAFDIVRGTWQQLSPDDAGPSRRYGHSAILDTARDRMVISHGFTSAGRFDDTWAFDLATNLWRDISPPARPLRRCLHHAAYDAANGQMWLYGGCSSGFGPCPQGDLWSFDLSTNRWTERTAPTTNPPARFHYGMTFDASRVRLVVFGGSGSSLLNDTWEFDPRTGTWQQSSLGTPPPSPRQRQETAYDAERGTIFYFGGLTASGATNELWMLAPASAAPQVSSSGVMNAFSFEAGAVAPGEIVSIFGTRLGPPDGVVLGFDPQTGQLPVSSAGVSVAWNGVAAPLYFVRSDQLNVQVPYELQGAGEASLVVTANGQSSAAVTVPVAATRPGLFPKIWNQGGTVNATDNPAASGSVITLYATGQGVTNPPSRTGTYPTSDYPEPSARTALRIGGREAQILFQGQAPGTAGVMQINARLPDGVTGAAIAVMLSIGAQDSQSGVTIAIR